MHNHIQDTGHFLVTLKTQELTGIKGGVVLLGFFSFLFLAQVKKPVINEIRFPVFHAGDHTL